MSVPTPPLVAAGKHGVGSGVLVRVRVMVMVRVRVTVRVRVRVREAVGSSKRRTTPALSFSLDR